MIQTKDGHLWMINAGELCKFDGKDFTYFPLKNDITEGDKNVSLTKLSEEEIMFIASEFTKFNIKTETFIYYAEPPVDATKVFDNEGNLKGQMAATSHPFNGDGVVWFSNYLGIYKLFNDSCTKITNESYDIVLPKNMVLSIDNKGGSWVSSNKFLFKIQDDTLLKYDLFELGADTTSFPPFVKFIDSKGNIIFQVFSQVLNNDGSVVDFYKTFYYLDVKEKKITRINLEKKDAKNISHEFNGDVIERNGLFYFLTHNELLIYSSEKQSYQKIKLDGYYNQIVLAKDSNLFLYHNNLNGNSIAVVNKKNEIIYTPHKDKNVNKLLVDDENNIWLATKKGLVRYSCSQINFKAEKLFSESKLKIKSYVMDNLQNIWFTSGENTYDEYGEILAVEPKILHKFNTINENIESVLTTDDGFQLSWDDTNDLLWIESNGQFWQAKNNILATTDIIPPLGKAISYSLIKGAYFADVNWGENVYIFHDNTFKPIFKNNRINTQNKSSFFIHGDYKKGEVSLYNEETKNLDLIFKLDSNNSAVSVITDNNKNYWAFIYKNQKVYYSSPNLFLKKEKAYQNGGKRNINLKSIADKSGNAWVTSNMGLNVLSIDNDTIKSVLISKKDGLSSTIINDLYVDEHNFLWIATDNGVDRLDINSYLKNNIVNFKHFGEKEGLIDINSTEFVLRNKQLMVFTKSGYAVIDTTIKLTTLIAPTPYFTSLGYAVGEDFKEKNLKYKDKEIKINNPFGPIFISFNAIKFNNTRSLQYNVLLYKGGNLLYGSFDDFNWSTQEEIKYEGLAPGNYKVELYCRVGVKGEKSTPTILEFTILPVWWQTWWAKGLAVLLFLLVLYLLYKQRTKALLKRQEQLEETVKEKTAEVVVQKQEAEAQRDLAHEQKEEIEEQHKEITDSIAYAKRIQSAILPPAKLVKEYLKESFILYKPKDVVAGDFYWMEHADDKVLFAAADCTGHGVPGAMVSVVCNNSLNRTVREHGLTSPGEILDKTREIIIQEFEKSDEDVKDGMDIALCSLEGMNLQYAGANNPLWIIRNGEIIETKANKQPIGQFDNPLPYTTHSFDLESGDSVYIFSDGYVDQFGGEKGKKFKAKAFRELLLSIQKKNMEEQKIIIDEAFETWKGSLEQIDDVCIIGVRV